MATSHERGWETLYNWELEAWCWKDTGLPVEGNPRPCKRCGEYPTPEGYDACLGYIEGVKSACCGHGVSKKIMMRINE